MESVPKNTLLSIQRHFHAVIRERSAELIDRHNVALPELTPLLLLATEEQRAWFPVPGMYGGFSYWFEENGDETKLIVVSWCRIVGGSGQRHEITAVGSQLVAEGFV